MYIVPSLLTSARMHTVNHDQEISFDEFIPWYHRMAEKIYIRFVHGLGSRVQGSVSRSVRRVCRAQKKVDAILNFYLPLAQGA